jgi:hypothetical protein
MVYVLKNPIPNIVVKNAEENVKNNHQCHIDDDDEQIVYVALASMSPELQRQYENMDVYTMTMHLKELFDETSRTERYEISKKLFRCKMTESFSMNTHVW